MDTADLFEVRHATATRGHHISCLNRSALSMLDYHSVSLMSATIYLLILLTSH